MIVDVRAAGVGVVDVDCVDVVCAPAQRYDKSDEKSAIRHWHLDPIQPSQRTRVGCRVRTAWTIIAISVYRVAAVVGAIGKAFLSAGTAFRDAIQGTLVADLMRSY